MMAAQVSLAAGLQEFVDTGSLAGLVAFGGRDGVTELVSAGWRDREQGIPMTADSLFRIASLTKPVTSVAAMTMVEEGRFALDDAIDPWAPEFSALRVLRAPDGSLDDTVPARRSITFRDLLTHRSGLSYGSFHAGPIGAAYDAALGGAIDSHVAPDDWVAALGALPLISHPGEHFRYGRSTDLLGFLLGRIDGTTVGEVLRRRVLEPLQMSDTAFTVPPEQRQRRAQLYGFDDSGRLIPRLTAAAGSTLAERPDDMAYESGGQGLWSTAADYARFARLFVGQGQVDGVCVLRPETLALMTTNHLSPAQRSAATMLGTPLFARGHGFGLGLAVVLEPGEAQATLCRGSVGTVGWPGAFGSWWQADPADRSVYVLLTHSVVEPEQMALGVGLETYMARARFHELAACGEGIYNRSAYNTHRR